MHNVLAATGQLPFFDLSENITLFDCRRLVEIGGRVRDYDNGFVLCRPTGITAMGILTRKCVNKLLVIFIQPLLFH